MEETNLKEAVRDYWNAEPCGTRGVRDDDRRAYFRQIEAERYQMEPYIRDFARFERGRDQKLLEVGVGAGTDFMQWVRAGAKATGLDLTEQGISLTRDRVALEGREAELRVGDAENLPFPNDTFDIVYSYGVLHHSPNTQTAVKEVHRVLKPGGTALVMIYHSQSWVVFILWLMHCVAKLRPWKSPRWAAFHYLESPGTKVYTREEARRLFSDYSKVKVWTQLAHGDQLLMRPGARYQSLPARILWRLYPRWLVRLTGNRFGLALMIEATK